MATDEIGYAWRVTNHVGRCCFGRILARKQATGRTLYRCANCGAEEEGSSERCICVCGLKMKTGADAGMRCFDNDTRSPEFPSEIVAGQIANL